MALSENSKKVFEYLKGFVGREELTLNSIGEACGLSPKSINGILLSFTSHKLVERKTAIDSEGNIVKYVVPTEAILTYDPDAAPASSKKETGHKYSDTTKAIIKLLKGKVGSNEKFTAQNIADALSIPTKTVNATLNALKNKGYVDRSEPKGVMIDGKAVNVRYIQVFPTINDVDIQ